MSDDGQKKRLEAVADAVDRAADEHSDHPRPCDSTAILRQLSGSIRASATGSGPPQVATAAYRAGWDTLFGGKQPVGQA